MSDCQPLTETEIDFLAAFLPSNNVHSAPDDAAGKLDLPFVTLTYASSLDSMISLAPGLRTTLSGPETKSMTHYLRLHHDAILVGVGTAIPDDPGLNCRYPGATLASQPRPVVVDPQMRWTVAGSKLEQLAGEKRGKAPWIICTPRPLLQDPLTACGGERLHIPGGLQDGHETIEWTAILRTLKSKGINSVMIEGGATVISTLLSMPGLIDSVIITIAPTWLGQGGVTVSPPSRSQGGERVNAARLQQTSWRQFGQDAVLCGKLWPH